MKTESMIKRSFQLTVLLSIILGIVSCNYITGEGPIVEKKMTVERFSGVELDGSFDVNIDQGMVQSVTVKGHENIIDELRLNVMDNVLYISLEPGSYINYELGVNITLPDLKLARLLGSGDIQLGTFVGLSSVNLEIDGSGDIETKEESVLEVNDKASVKLEGSGDYHLMLKATSVEALLKGSGDIDLSGITKEFDAQLDGSGDIKAYDLESMSCNANLDGSGSIRVNASKKLKASLDGSGDITYKGEPKVEASIDGSGTISAK